MDLITVLYLLGIIVISSIPFEQFLDWLKVKNRHLSGQLEYPTVFMPTKGFRIAFSVIFSFLKGYLPLLIGYLYIDLPFTLLGVLLSLCLHLWSPFLLFKPSGYILSFLLGIYCYFYIPMIVIVPIMFCILSLALNSIALGMTVTVLAQFLFLNLVNGHAEIFLINIGIFLCLFFRWSGTIFNHFEKAPVTLYQSLLKR